MTKIFPKARIQFCKTADGTNVYRVWRHCGTIVTDCWFSLEPVQNDELSDSDFDVRELLNLDGSNLPDAKTSCAAIQSVTDQEIRKVTLQELGFQRHCSLELLSQLNTVDIHNCS